MNTTTISLGLFGSIRGNKEKILKSSLVSTKSLYYNGTCNLQFPGRVLLATTKGVINFHLVTSPYHMHLTDARLFLTTWSGVPWLEVSAHDATTVIVGDRYKCRGRASILFKKFGNNFYIIDKHRSFEEPLLDITRRILKDTSIGLSASTQSNLASYRK